MERRDFLKKVGIGAVMAPAVLPAVISAVPKGKEVMTVDVADIPDGYTLKDVLDIYNQTGHMIVQKARRVGMTYSNQAALERKILRTVGESERRYLNKYVFG